MKIAVGQQPLAVASPPIVEKWHAISLCKFVESSSSRRTRSRSSRHEEDDDDDEDDDENDDDEENDHEDEHEEKKEGKNDDYTRTLILVNLILVTFVGFLS